MKRGLADQASSLLIKAGAAGLVLMTAVVGWQVFGRFVLNSSPSWSEQTALLLMIWYVFFAAAAGVWERFHIRIEVLENRLTEHRRKWLRIAIHALIAVFGLVLCVYGAMLAWMVRDFVIPSLGISRAVAYLAIPLSGLLIALFSLGRMHARWRGEP
ncbi:hypothetical protein HME9302_00297 [Alteripontixanthobacter maritimus]|uniref:TRAP transporter small permease protein n=1 Tax=Alteripontixanthobacter maritimus TaxID=2161824 RepID=A0A369Q3M4_9SPHN|nr:TRAP transporter small permease [Alteripontixanthobacter maritimus]RDC59112.1 hypothetical protein HME9302_00297 [Alteripontixanthobacter maritimus]